MPQPWHDLAAVYERNGQPADARWMRFQAAKRTTGAARWHNRLPRYGYALLVGHGYYPLRAGLWLAGALVLSFGLVWCNQATFIPTDYAKAVRAVQTAPARTNTSPETDLDPAPPVVTGATDCHDLEPNYPCFKSSLYTLDTALPAGIDTGQANAWRFNTTGTHWLPVALSVLRIFTWLTAALLLAGVTGLLRKT